MPAKVHAVMVEILAIKRLFWRVAEAEAVFHYISDYYLADCQTVAFRP